MNYHKLDVAAVCLGDELGLVALAADALRLAVLDGALQVRLGPRRVPETEEPGPDDDDDYTTSSSLVLSPHDGAGESHPPARHHQHRLRLVGDHQVPDAEARAQLTQHQHQMQVPGHHVYKTRRMHLLDSVFSSN